VARNMETRGNVSVKNHHLSSGGGTGIWMDEEKSDKIGGIPTTGAGAVLQTTSSSDYDTDGDISNVSKGSRQMLEGPSHSQATDVSNEFFTSSRFAQSNALNNKNNSNNLIQNHHYNKNRKVDDDDRTFDYGDRDDGSNGSTSYAARERKEAERRARMVAESSLGGGQTIYPSQDFTNGGDRPSAGINGSASGVTPEELPSLRRCRALLQKIN
jgi:hypothetical protein